VHPMTATRLPILVAGAGAMGGALIAGWRRADAIAAGDILIRDPHPGSDALAAVTAGAALNPPDLSPARTVIFAVKPQMWRAAAAELAPLIAPDAAVISVIAGLAEDAAALFAPLGAVTRLADEELMHVATAASGSAPAYLYAFIEALEAGAAEAGLPADDAARMVRATICGAAALLTASGDDPAELRRRVTSPGGTTQAALAVLAPELPPLMARAVAAAVARSRELGG